MFFCYFRHLFTIIILIVILFLSLWNFLFCRSSLFPSLFFFLFLSLFDRSFRLLREWEKHYSAISDLPFFIHNIILLFSFVFFCLCRIKCTKKENVEKNAIVNRNQNRLKTFDWWNRNYVTEIQNCFAFTELRIFSNCLLFMQSFLNILSVCDFFYSFFFSFFHPFILS